jgi:hypothetical protein
MNKSKWLYKRGVTTVFLKETLRHKAGDKNVLVNGIYS